MVEIVIFSIILSLFFVHEMDAVRAKEWKMFIGLKKLSEKAAFLVFTIIHLPLYFAIIFIMTFCNDSVIVILIYIISGFMIFHAIIHFIFKNHPDNGFNSFFQKLLYMLPQF